MSNRNKNKNNSRLKNQEKQKSVEYQDYDLAQSFSKVHQYSQHTRKNSITEVSQVNKYQLACL